MAAAVSWPKLADTAFCRVSVFAGTFLKSVVPSPSSPASSVPPHSYRYTPCLAGYCFWCFHRNCLFLCCSCLHENQSLFLNINFPWKWKIWRQRRNRTAGTQTAGSVDGFSRRSADYEKPFQYRIRQADWPGGEYSLSFDGYYCAWRRE